MSKVNEAQQARVCLRVFLKVFLNGKVTVGYVCEIRDEHERELFPLGGKIPSIRP